MALAVMTASVVLKLAWPFGEAAPVRAAAAPRAMAAPNAVQASAAPSPTAAPNARTVTRAPVHEVPYRALLVGIDRAAGRESLTGSVADALGMRDVLIGFGVPAENIRVLTERNANAAAILAGIGWLGELPDHGRAVFSYTGHTERDGTRNSMVVADGSRLADTTLAKAMHAVRAPMFSLWATCYAAGFNLPGIAGPNRIAVYASGAEQQAYTTGERSVLGEFMVRRTMDRLGVGEVETAFIRAAADMLIEYPSTRPAISDGFDGVMSLRIALPQISASAPGAAAVIPAAPTPKQPRETPGGSAYARCTNTRDLSQCGL